MNPVGLLEKAVLIRRYKRFLADVELSTGEIVVVHCPNPGSMLGCAEPGSAVFLRKSDSTTRKLPYTWVITEVGPTLVSVDTLLANKVVGEALRERRIPALSQYEHVLSEYNYGDSRFDFCLGTAKDFTPECIVEVKSTTLCEGNVAMFPDAKTERGRKHLHGLIEAKKQGLRAVQFFCIARNDISSFTAAKHIDPAYAEALCRAAAAGVEVMAWTTRMAIDNGSLAVHLHEQIDVVL